MGIHCNNILKLSGLPLAAIALLIVAGCATSTSSSGKPVAYHYQMGISYLEERDYTSALTELTEAEKIEPNVAELQYNLGRTLVGKRRPDLAEAKFLRAIALKPHYSAARNDLGVLYLETARWDNAVQQFKAVKDDLFYPRHDHAGINLGLAYLGRGDYDAALAEFSSVRAIDPRNPIIMVATGRVLFAQGKTRQAITEYYRAIEVAPEYQAAHFHLGMALMKDSRLDAASAAFKEVVRISPDSELGYKAAGYVDLLR